jgi:hypothetical protein
MEQMVKIQNGGEELKRIGMNQNENQNSRRKRSNTLKDTL